MKVKQSSGLPANFDDLPRDLQIQIEEDVYRRQLRWAHGHRPGDPCLKSMGADGIPLSSTFGKKVDGGGDEVEDGV